MPRTSRKPAKKRTTNADEPMDEYLERHGFRYETDGSMRHVFGMGDVYVSESSFKGRAVFDAKNLLLHNDTIKKLIKLLNIEEVQRAK